MNNVLINLCILFLSKHILTKSNIHEILVVSSFDMSHLFLANRNRQICLTCIRNKLWYPPIYPWKISVSAIWTLFTSLTNNSESIKDFGDNDNKTNTLIFRFDPELSEIIKEEDKRQKNGLQLIASENFASRVVRESLGSCLTNKYSEVGKRFYGGNKFIDKIESICIFRALSLYNLDPEKWGVNVQPYSGSPANFAVYSALLKPHDRIMGLDLYSGGHLTHGFKTLKRKVSATSIYFESMPYVVHSLTGYIDYHDMERRAKMFMPKLMIAGGSSYPREWDYERIKHIANSVDALFMVDMAHVSGLVAGKCVNNIFKYADVVTSTTHKTLRGPRSGIIFAKKDLMHKINGAVFPTLQGGPHNHQISALAVALKEAHTSQFMEYTACIIKNAQALVGGLIERGHKIITGGSDNHLLLWDVKNVGGEKFEKVLDMISISTNKNIIPGDKSSLYPNGIRLGTAALTTRGYRENDFLIVAKLLDKGYHLALKANKIAEKKISKVILNHDEDTSSKRETTLKCYLRIFEDIEEFRLNINNLRNEVEAFSLNFGNPDELEF